MQGQLTCEARRYWLKLLTLILLLASPASAWSFFEVSQTLINGCSPALIQFKDTRAGSFTAPQDTTATCMLGKPPTPVTEISKSSIEVTQPGPNLGTRDAPIPYKAVLTSQTSVDSGVSTALTANFRVVFDPPSGTTAFPVTFSLVDHAHFSIVTPDARLGRGDAFVDIHSPDAPALAQHVEINTAVNQDIDVVTPEVVIPCCDVLVRIRGFASAAGNATATLTDPVDIVLTPQEVAAGWHWQITEVPEPATWMWLAIGAMIALVWHARARGCEQA
jgi:hypothetical protein